MKHLHITSPTHTIAHRLLRHCSLLLVGCLRHDQKGTHHINVSENAVCGSMSPICDQFSKKRWYTTGFRGSSPKCSCTKPIQDGLSLHLMDYGLVEGSSRRLHGHVGNLSSGQGAFVLFGETHIHMNHSCWWAVTFFGQTPKRRWMYLEYIDEATWGKK